MDSVRMRVERYAPVAQSTRKGIDQAQDNGDQDTADWLTEVSRDLDKALWFLEAHIQQEE